MRDCALVELDQLSLAAEFAQAFARWAGDSDQIIVLFTPNVLMAVSNVSSRGYLYDDGWSIEVWVERDAERFLKTIEDVPRLDGKYSVREPKDPNVHNGLTAVALEKGAPLPEVRHLL